MGDVASLVRSRMNGLLLFESTIKQTTEIKQCPKTITAATVIKQQQLMTAATILKKTSHSANRMKMGLSLVTRWWQ